MVLAFQRLQLRGATFARGRKYVCFSFSPSKPLKANRSTMAVTLMSDMFASDGYVAQLRSRGYEVLAPE